MNTLYSLKKIIISTFFFFIFFSSFAQNDGDYRTTGSGTLNWSTVANWEVYNSGSWSAATEYPGQTTVAGMVTVLSGAQIALDITPAHVIESLLVQGDVVIGNDATQRIIEIKDSIKVYTGGKLASGSEGAPAHVIKLHGDLTNDGDINLQQSFTNVVDVELYGTGSIKGANSPVFNNLTFKNGCDIKALLTLDVNKNIYIESGAKFDDGGLAHTIEYEWYNYGGTYVASGTIVFDGGTGAIANSGANTTFNDLAFTGGGLNVIKQPVVVNGNFSISNNTKVAPGNISVTVNGNFSVDAGSEYTQVQNATYFRGASAQTLDLNGDVSFYSVAFYDGGANAKTINGTLLVNGALTINTGAKVSGSGNQIIYRGFRINGTCDFTGSVTVKGGYIDASDAGVTNVSIGTAKLIIDGSVYMRHTTNGNVLTLNVDNNVEIKNGYLVINDDARLAGNTLDTLKLESGRTLYVRGSDNFPTGFKVYDIDPASRVTYDANMPQTVRGGSDIIYGHIYLNNDVKTVDGDLTIKGNLTMNGTSTPSTFDLQNYTHIFSGHGIYNGNNSSIDGSNATFIIGDKDDAQYINANGTGSYTFNNLIIRETNATASRTKYFYNGCNITILNDFTVENVGGTSAIQLIVDLNDNGIAGPANNFSLGANCILRTDNVDFGANAIDNFSGTKNLDDTSTVYYSLDGDQTIASGITYGSIIFYSGNKTASGPLDINGDIKRTGSVVFYDGGFTHYVAGNWYLNNANYYTPASATGTIVFDGNDQVIDGYNFNDLIIASSGDVSVARTLTIFNDIRVEDGSTFDIATLSLNVGGNITVQGEGVLKQSTGTTTMNGTGKQYVSLNNNCSLGRFYINKPIADDTVKVLSELHVNGDTYIYPSAGVLDIRSKDIYFGGRLYRRENPGVINFLADTSNVYFNGVTAQYVYNYHEEDLVFNNLTFQGSGDKMLVCQNPSNGTASRNFIVKGDVTINNSVVDGYNVELYVYGNWNNTGTFNHGRTVYFTGADQQISSSSFYHVVFEGSGTKTLDGGITVAYDLTIDSVATLDADGNSITLGRTWDNSDSRSSFIPGTGKVTFNGASGAHIYTGTTTGAQSGKTFYDIEINKTGSTYLNGDFVIANDFVIGSGIFYTYDYDLWVGGNFDINGTFTTNGTGNVLTLNASGGVKVFNPNGATLQKVIFNASGTRYDQKSDFVIDNNDMDIIAGTLDMNGNSIKLYDNGRKINIAGGALRIDTSAVVEFTSGQSIDMTSGDLYILGLSDTLAVLKNSNTNSSVLFTLNLSGGTIHAQNYKIQQGKIILSNSVSIDPTYNLSGGVYTNGAGSDAYLTLTGLTFSDFQIDNMTFNTGPAYNVSRTSGSGTVTFNDATGGLAGEDFDEDDADPGSLIVWSYPVGYYWDGGAGTSNWNDAANWEGDNVPTASDIVYLNHKNITGSYSVNITNADAVCARLNMDSGNDGITLTVGSGRKLAVIGDVTISANSTLAQTDNTSLIYVENSWTNLGTYNHGNSTVVFNASTGSYIIASGGTGSGKTFYNLTIDAGVSKYMLDAALEVENDITITSGTLDLASPSNDVTIKGDWFVDQASGGDFKASLADVTFAGGEQNITNGIFYNLIIGGSNTTHLNSNIAVEHALTLNNGSDFDGQDYNIYIHLDWINNGGDFTQTGFGTVVFDGTESQHIDYGTNSTTFNNISFSNGGRKYFQRDVFVNGSVMIYATSGTVNLRDRHLTGNGTDNTLTCNHNLQIEGANNFPEGFETINLATNSSVLYYADIDQNIYPATYGNIYLRSATNNVSTPAKKIATDDLEIKGNLNIDGYRGRLALLDMATNDKNITLTGGINMAAGCSIDWGTGNSTLTHVGGRWYIDPDITDFNNLILAGTDAKYLQGDGTISPLIIKGDLAIKSGVDLRMYSTSGVDNYRRIQGTSSGTISMETSARILNTTPGDVAAAIPEDFGTYNFNENSSYLLFGTGDQIIYTGSGIAYGNVIFYNDKTVTSDGIADLDINGDFNIYESTFVDNGKDIKVAGAQFYLTHYVPSSTDRKIILDGLRDQRISNNRGTSLDVASIQFSGTQTKTLCDGNDDVTINGDLLIDNGVTVVTNRDVTFNGVNWINNGIYKQTSHKLVFNGASDQTIDPGQEDPDNYFYNLEFTNASKKTFINNGFNVNGDLTIEQGTVDLNTLKHYLYDELFNTNGGILISKDADIVLDGGYQELYTPDFEVNNITCSGTGRKSMQSDWIINGSLVIDTASTLTTYNRNSDDPHYYDIYIKRNWTNYGTFNDYNTKVIFNGSVPSVSVKSGGSNFYNVDFLPTANVTYKLQSETTRIANELFVGTNATLELNGNDLYLNRNHAAERLQTIEGTLTVDADAKLIVNNYPVQDTILVKGRLNLIGLDNSHVATLTSENTDNRNKTIVNIESGATFAARNYLVEYISDSGLNLAQGSKLDATNNLSDGTWLNLRNVQDARYIVLEADYSGDTIKNVSFGYNGVPEQDKHFNVERKLASSTIVFKNITGAIGTYRYEIDDEATPSNNSGLLHWPEVTETYWTGAIDVDWHKEGNWDNGVPTSSKDAVIEDKDNDPVVFSADAECKGLKIVDGTLRLEGGNDLIVSSDLSVATGLLYVNSSSSDIIIGGDWITDTQGHFSHGNASVIFNSGEGSATVVPGYENFNNIEFDNANTTFQISGATLFLDGDLTIKAGTVSPVTNNYNFYIKGDYSINNGTFNTDAASNGTIHLNGDGDQTVNDGTFYNLIVDGTGDKLCNGTVTVFGKTTINSTLKAESGCSIDFKGDMQINSSGTFDDGGESHTFNGVNWHGDGTYSAGTGTVTFNRTDRNQYLYNGNFNNLVIDCTGRSLYLMGDVNVTGDVTIKSGVPNVLLQTNTITSDGTGTFTVEGGINLYVNGADNFPKSFSSYDISATSYTRYYGYSDQTIAGGVSYGHLVLNNENTKTLSGDIEVKGRLTFNNSTLDVSANNYTISIGGDYWYNYSTGNFICRQGEVIFNGAVRQFIGTGSSNINSFYDLTINNTADYVYANNNSSNDFIVKRNLTVNSSKFNANGRVIYVGGDLIATGTGGFVRSGTYYLNKVSGNASIGMNGTSVHHLTINGGATYTAIDDLMVSGDFNLISGTFNGDGKSISLGNDGVDVVSVDGTYIVGAGGVLGIGNGTTMKVSNSGRIEVVGGVGGIAKVTNNASGGRYNFTVEGQIAADNYLFEYMSENGIYLTETSTIDGTSHFSNGTFSNGYSRGQLLHIENTQSFTGGNRIENVSFPYNPGGSASNIAKYSSTNGTLEFYNCSGVFAGESFDNDPNNLIIWTGPVKLTWNGSVNTDWNNVGNWSASSGSPIVPVATSDVIIPDGLVNYPNLTTTGQTSANLTIESGGQMRINTPYDNGDTDLDINGAIIINGQLLINSTNDFVNVEGDWLQASSAVVINNGTVTFDGTSGGALINSRGTGFNDLIFDGATQYQLGAATTVSGNLIIKSGAYFGVGDDQTLTLKENYENNGTFNCEKGKVIFSSDNSNVNILAGTSPFYDVEISSSGTVYSLNGGMRVLRDLKIIDGILNANANALRIGRNVSISGGLKINAGATLDMDDGAAVAVNDGGLIELLGTDDANRAALTSTTQGRYSFDVNSGGNIKAQYYSVDYTDADGLYMAPGANIDATYNLSDGVFSNGYPNSGSYMTLLHEMGVDDFTLKNLVFNSGPKYNVTRTSGTTVFYFEDASGDLGNYLYERDDESTPDPSTGLLRWPYVKFYTWEGDVNSSWSEAGNWFNDMPPETSSDVTITNDGTGNNPVISPSDGEIEIHGLTVESGASLTIQPGSKVTLNGGDLSTASASSIIIQNSESLPTCVINEGSVTDEVTVQWTYPDSRYMYVGHSVDGALYSDYSSVITDPDNDLWLYRWPGHWTRIVSDDATSTGLSGSEHALEGYAVKLKEESPVTVSHTGDLRNAGYTATFDGWKLTANPYQSYIDITSLGLGSTANQTIWTSTNASGDLLYATYNIYTGDGTNGASQYIAPGQSFWIYHDGTSELSVSPDDRTYGDGGKLKGATVKNDVLRLTLNNDGLSDEVVILLRPEGTLDHISDYDSEKRIGSARNVPNIYSLKGNDSKVVIGLYPDDIVGDTIRLGYKFSQSKVITLKADNINEFNVVGEVYLFDKQTGVEINLKETPEYSFTSVAGEETDRFLLYFDHVATGLGDSFNSGTSSDKVLIYGTGSEAVIKVSEKIIMKANGEGIIRIYNALGSLLKEAKLVDKKTTIRLPYNHGVYIIEVRAGETVKTGKVTVTR